MLRTWLAGWLFVQVVGIREWKSQCLSFTAPGESNGMESIASLWFSSNHFSLPFPAILVVTTWSNPILLLFWKLSATPSSLDGRSSCFEFTSAPFPNWLFNRGQFITPEYLVVQHFFVCFFRHSLSVSYSSPFSKSPQLNSIRSTQSDLWWIGFVQSWSLVPPVYDFYSSSVIVQWLADLQTWFDIYTPTSHLLLKHVTNERILLLIILQQTGIYAAE